MSTESSHSLLALLIASADKVIGDLRLRFDPSARRSLGAHITIRFDWLSPQQIGHTDHERLQEICAGVAPFDICLARLAEFPHVVYLAPEPATPIAGLEATLSEHYPRREERPFTPHVTIGRKLNSQDQAEVRRAAEVRIEQHGIIVTHCDRMTLLISRNKQWVVERTYPLGR